MTTYRVPTTAHDSEQPELTLVTGTISASGNTTVVAAPAAGSRVVVREFFVQRLTTNTTTVTLKDASTTLYVMTLNGEVPGVWVFWPPESELAFVAAHAVVINLDVSEAVKYSLRYYTETV